MRFHYPATTVKDWTIGNTRIMLTRHGTTYTVLEIKGGSKTVSQRLNESYARAHVHGKTRRALDRFANYKK